jgi:hypothetical protein
LAATGLIRGVNQLAVFPLFLFHLDGQADVVGIFVDDALDLPGLGVVQRVFTQVQDNAGATLRAGDGFHLKRAATAGAAVAHPTHTFIGLEACAAGFHRDFVGHDKARVKAHAKLANKVAVGLLVASELAHKVFGAALGNGAQVVNGFLLREANAVVSNGQRLCIFVKGDFDLQLGVVLVQAAVVDGLKAQLVAGV